MLRVPSLALLLVASLCLLAGCKSAYYSTMETFGQQKRDILVTRVEKGRSSQEAAQQQFQKTLESFELLSQFDGGDLEDLYGKLKKEYERCESRAAAVRERIEGIQSVARDMFREWGEEIERDITDPDLAQRSLDLKAQSEERYGLMMERMEAAAGRMDPVLGSFRSHVTFLKHNLNAQAVTALEDSVLEIQGDVAALVQEMQAAIDEAGAFIDQMGS